MNCLKRPVRTTRQPVLDINIIATASAIILVLFAFPAVAAISDLVNALREHDEKSAEKVIELRHEIRRLSDEFIIRQSERIAGRAGAQVELIRLEMELLDNMRRIYTRAKRVAKEFVPEQVADNTA